MVVSLSDADVTAMDGPAKVMAATRRIIAAFGGPSFPVDGRRDRRSEWQDAAGAATPLIVLETPYRASTLAEAHEHAKATGGAVLRGDRFAAPSYFDVHSWRSMVAVRAGVPMVSYSRAVWPIISQPPRGEHWAAAGQHQPQAVHDLLSDYFLLALSARLRAVSGGRCDGTAEGGAASAPAVTGLLSYLPYLREVGAKNRTSPAASHSTAGAPTSAAAAAAAAPTSAAAAAAASATVKRPTLSDRASDEQGTCLDETLTWLPAVERGRSGGGSGGSGGGGVAGALASVVSVVAGEKNEEGWLFYEDTPGKPGWIYEGRHARPTSTLVVPVNVSTQRPTSINIGYLKSHACMGSVRIWLEKRSSSRSSSSSSSSSSGDGSSAAGCEMEVNGHSNHKVSIGATASFQCGQQRTAPLRTGGNGVAEMELHVRPAAVNAGTFDSDPSLSYCAGGLGFTNKFKLMYVESCASDVPMGVSP